MLKSLPALAMLFLAALSFAIVLHARDPVAFLAWLFCFALAVTGGNATATGDAADR
jgi:hypothetical protein